MHGGYMFHVRPLIQEAYATGLTKTLQEQILLNFQVQGVRPHERALALKSFAFRGLYQEQDEVTTVAPDYRISVFDTTEHGWPDEIRQQVEEKLLTEAAGSPVLLLAPESSVPPPWPRYDSFRGPAGKLVEKLVNDGHDLDDALTYERATQKRPQVIEAIEAALASPRVELEEEVVG